MNKIGGFLILVLTTLFSALLILGIFVPAFSSTTYLLSSAGLAILLIGLIILGAKSNIKAAEFRKEQTEDDD